MKLLHPLAELISNVRRTSSFLKRKLQRGGTIGRCIYRTIPTFLLTLEPFSHISSELGRFRLTRSPNENNLTAHSRTRQSAPMHAVAN
jgi:hypothetical protein